jgi:hypothetical protein
MSHLRVRFMYHKIRQCQSDGTFGEMVLSYLSSAAEVFLRLGPNRRFWVQDAQVRVFEQLRNADLVGSAVARRPGRTGQTRA